MKYLILLFLITHLSLISFSWNQYKERRKEQKNHARTLRATHLLIEGFREENKNKIRKALILGPSLNAIINEKKVEDLLKDRFNNPPKRRYYRRKRKEENV